MRTVFLHTIRFIFLVFIQLTIVNQINLGFLNSYISIFVYISFLLTFPVNISKYLFLVVAFITGLTMDMFLDTSGIHASACLVLAYARPFLLNRIQTKDKIGDIEELNVYSEVIQNYLIYCFLLYLLFFSWLFLLEEFNFLKLPLIILKAVLSSSISLLLTVLGQYLLIRKPKT